MFIIKILYLINICIIQILSQKGNGNINIKRKLNSYNFITIKIKGKGKQYILGSGYVKEAFLGESKINTYEEHYSYSIKDSLGYKIEYSTKRSYVSINSNNEMKKIL